MNILNECKLRDKTLSCSYLVQLDIIFNNNYYIYNLENKFCIENKLCIETLGIFILKYFPKRYIISMQYPIGEIEAKGNLRATLYTYTHIYNDVGTRLIPNIV